ncbi:Hypothetical_protein [Hexamita inflata]|uniref:Hypothetical_protein n=1 Tax=Hexamita inflata TaxID=28002 RepID=A0AA86NFZ2_9EUKA|nr:Hypothetical protein HINF_LOCUS6592 [Hexamita inflata]
MESEQNSLQCSPERFAYGMDDFGYSMQDPLISKERDPELLRESRIIFQYFGLLRPLDILQDSQIFQRQQMRASQHGSALRDEYIGTSWPAATLKKKTHLSFQQMLSIQLCSFQPSAGCPPSLSLARPAWLFLEPLVLRVNCLNTESPLEGNQNPRIYSTGPTEARITFPFLSHLRQCGCRLFLLASVVFISEEVEWTMRYF